MSKPRYIGRRKVLKTIGAGIIGSVIVSGSANARGDYGNGNAIGKFLQEDAVFKDRPLWSSGVTDMTGHSSVEVRVGTVTSVDIPAELVPPGVDVPEELPMAFSPKVVKVSPGTDVTWTWVLEHHSVTSVAGTGETFDEHGGPGHDFTYTFDDVGNYLYYCIPHGLPFPVDFGPPIGEVENLFGMRGAVKVSDD